MTSFRNAFLAAILVAPSGPGFGAEVPNAAIVLQVPFQARAGQVAQAAPERFIMLNDGQVFVGGTSDVETCRLEKGDLKSFLAEVEAIRKPRKKKKRNDPGQPWLGGPTTWSFGGSSERVFLTFLADEKEKLPALRLELVGDPRRAPRGLKVLGDFVLRLSEFDHPCLRPYAAASYRMRASKGTMPGGCRAPGGLEPSLALALDAPTALPAAAAKDWPHGATAAQLCQGDARYIVTLTPLLPGERP